MKHVSKLRRNVASASNSAKVRCRPARPARNMRRYSMYCPSSERSAAISSVVCSGTPHDAAHASRSASDGACLPFSILEIFVRCQP